MIAAFFKKPIVLVFILIFVAVALTYLILPKSFRPTLNARVKDVLTCDTRMISPAVQEQTVAKARKLRLLISFHQQPTNEEVVAFAEQEIRLYPETWIFDYLVGEAGYDRLCNLARDQRVSYIDMAP